MTCSRRQKTARRSPGASASRKPSSASTGVAAPAAGLAGRFHSGWPKRCGLSCSRATRPARSCSSRRCACSTRRHPRGGRARALRPLARATAARRTTRWSPTAAAALRDARFGLKAATITPEGADDVGSPNRILREELDGKVIIRTGRRIPGVTPVAGVHYPIAVVRMAVGDAYGAEQWREEENGDEYAFRTERISRSVCRAVAEYAFRTADRIHGRVYGGPKWTVSPVYEGLLKEEMDAASDRHPEVPYSPVLIDATYAGLISGRRRRAARDPRAQPRRRLPVGPRAAAVRLDRGRRVGAAGPRRGLRADRRHGGGAARHRPGARTARTSPTRWR